MVRASARHKRNLRWAVDEAVLNMVQSRKLKSRFGARNRLQEPSLELSSQAART
jgi:hypothetical protein